MSVVGGIEEALLECECSVELLLLESQPSLRPMMAGNDGSPSLDRVADYTAESSQTQHRTETVAAYSKYLIYVLRVVLYEHSDSPASSRDGGNGNSSSTRRPPPPTSSLPSPYHPLYLSSAVTASGCLQRILGLDQDLCFLPFLFSAYLFYGSVPFLSRAGQLMEMRVDAATSYTEQCSRTLIQAHQVLLATFDAGFQRFAGATVGVL
ncbi:hypothetical protein BJX65DRAFT_312560 [Aspergillus insuetus]